MKLLQKKPQSTIIMQKSEPRSKMYANQTEKQVI